MSIQEGELHAKRIANVFNRNHRRKFPKSRKTWNNVFQGLKEKSDN